MLAETERCLLVLRTLQGIQEKLPWEVSDLRWIVPAVVLAAELRFERPEPGQQLAPELEPELLSAVAAVAGQQQPGPVPRPVVVRQPGLAPAPVPELELARQRP